MSAPEVRCGVVGTGPVADKVCADLALTPGAVLHGVCSRTASRAATFAARHGAARTSVDPAALAADVDVVYVATPHAAHLDAATAAMEAGTAVLVEKPLTATLAGARRLAEVAREREVFCMEAMWTRFLPVTADLLDVVEGSLGRIRLEAPLYAPPGMTVLHGVRRAAEPADRTVRPGHRGAGYVHMLEHVQECVRAGRSESPLHPLSSTLAVMEVLESALEHLGVARPDEVAPVGSRA